MNGLRSPSVGLAFVEEPVIAATSSTSYSLSMRYVTWESVQTATTCVNDMHAFVAINKAGLPESRANGDGVVSYKDRMVIPHHFGKRC